MPIGCLVFLCGALSPSGFLTTISGRLYLMATKLPRPRHWLIMLGVPAFMAGGHMVVSLPASAALLTTTDPLWIWTGATVSIALGLLMVHVLGLALCKDGWGAQKTGTLVAS
jgi:hypothetical protein